MLCNCLSQLFYFVMMVLIILQFAYNINGAKEMYLFYMEKYNKRWWPYILLITTFPGVNLSYRAFKITRAKTEEDQYNLGKSSTKKCFSYCYIFVGFLLVIGGASLYVYIEYVIGPEKQHFEPVFEGNDIDRFTILIAWMFLMSNYILPIILSCFYLNKVRGLKKPEPKAPIDENTTTTDNAKSQKTD